MSSKDCQSSRSSFSFLLNDKLIQVDSVEPTTSLLNYLRDDLKLMGSKEGCAEGDCGACTVIMGSLINKKLKLQSINACIKFIPSVAGKAIYTVEYLKQANNVLHPVQQAMVDCHGSQCGFCTPGFIMSLWGVYLQHLENNSTANDEQIRSAISGNLCRCTGYKPILSAANKMFESPRVSFDFNKLNENLKRLKQSKSKDYSYQNQNFHSPTSLSELTRLKSENNKATILSGSTDIGLWVNKQFKNLNDIIYIGDVEELQQISVENNQLRIGATVCLTDAFESIHDYYPEVFQQWQRFASTPIRNAGTLGGNIANGSPIGDAMPWLIVLGAQVELASINDKRLIPLQDFYLDYMKNAMREDEFVQSIILPVEQQNLIFRTYKVSKRYDSDISAVCAGFAIKLNANQVVEDVKIAYGGMAGIVQRASECEAVLRNYEWNESTLTMAMRELEKDFKPLSDMRASAKYRMQCAQNLLYRFYLETKPQLPMKSNQLSVYERTMS